WQASSAGSVPMQQATNATPTPAPAARKVPEPTQTEPMWESLIDVHETEPSTGAMPASAPNRRKPWVWPSVAAGVLLLDLAIAWSAGVFRVRTPEGDIVFDGLPEQAVVTVDGTVCTVEWPGDQSPAKVTVPPVNI